MENESMEPTRSIKPSILYFGTPVVLLSTHNEDGSTNLTPMSSAWTLGTAMTKRLFELGWINRYPQGRAVMLTKDGAEGLLRQFGLDFSL